MGIVQGSNCPGVLSTGNCLRTVSVFISQILKQRKIVVVLLGTLILFAAIQLILLVT